MYSKKMPMKSLTFGKNIIHDYNGIDSECQTEEEPSPTTHDLSAKYLELLQECSTGDDFELRGFPNVLSVQKLLLQQSHQSFIQYTPSEAEETDNFTKVAEHSLMLSNHLINVRNLKIPSKIEECDSIMQYWQLHFPASKLKQFFSNHRQKISKKVLLEATQGLMVDSEFLSCDLVDMKWTFFLEGALAQAISECHKAPMESMKSLLQDFNNTRLNTIEQNKTIVANTKKHQLILENSICRMSRLSRRVALILGATRQIQQSRRCACTKNFPIVQLPRFPKSTLRKYYLIYFRGIRIGINTLPGHPNVIRIENSTKNCKNKSALVLAMKLLLQARPEELQILHMRDLDTFFELKRQSPSIAIK